VDARERFSAAADDYHRHRPSYPAALVDWILETAAVPRPGRIADVGCGTGIATRLFASRGHTLVGVDPNEDMLAFARQAGGGPLYVRGEAGATGLAEASFDLVIVAQALHWIAFPEFTAEARRILVGSGRCAAFWNLRQSGPFLDEYEKLLKAGSPEYSRVPRAKHAIEAIRTSPDVADLREAEFENAQQLDREGFFGRTHSSSYVAHGLSDPGAFDAALGALFDRHQVGGSVTLRYRAVAYAWRLRAARNDA
jgi:SAM-dependent methyltransferase